MAQWGSHDDKNLDELADLAQGLSDEEGGLLSSLEAVLDSIGELVNALLGGGDDD